MPPGFVEANYSAHQITAMLECDIVHHENKIFFGTSVDRQGILRPKQVGEVEMADETQSESYPVVVE